MSDKSPRSTSSKKSGKSLKEKRADKKAKGSGETSAPPPRPRLPTVPIRFNQKQHLRPRFGSRRLSSNP